MSQGRFILCFGVVVWWWWFGARVSDKHVTRVFSCLVSCLLAARRAKGEMAEYDLTRTIIPYLDRHLVFPLLTHLLESGLFSTEQVAAAQYELAKGTNMVDYIVSLYEQLNPDSEVPQGTKLLRLFLLYILSYLDA
jgi:hypothetical protein